MAAWKARASYMPGTNFKAWVFTILRNRHMSLGRRAWRSQPLDPRIAEMTLVANDDPHAAEELIDVRSAMLLLPFEQRQALALVGAAGLTYKEAAAICSCAEGTIKSRVSRARVELIALLDRRTCTRRASTDVQAACVLEHMLTEARAMKSPTADRRIRAALKPVA